MPNTSVKNFVIDTNVLLFDPESIFKFDNNNIIIPDVVIEELDHFKSEQSDRGSNSRKISRYLDELANKGSLASGVSLGENKGIIKIEFSLEYQKSNQDYTRLFKYDLASMKYDNYILYLCYTLSNCTLITKDVNLRVKANSINIPVEDYKNDKIISNTSEEYLGRTIAYAYSKHLNIFHDSGTLSTKCLLNEKGEKFTEKLYPNEFIEIYSCDTNNKSVLLGRFDGEKIVALEYDKSAMSGIKPQSIGQRFMKECLMQSPEIAPLVIIKGMAGCGKTLFALAAALDGCKKGQTTDYRKLLICRPSVTMDEDIGFLPGNENEKIAPYMRAIKDNLMLIKGNQDKTNLDSMHEYSQLEASVNELMLSNYVSTEALAYQRGRSLQNYFFLLDEMQNSTIRQAKDVVTRGGKGTKIVLLGDPDQIDSPYLDSYSNGLTFASECMKGSNLCWQVTLNEKECERSPLAKEAAIRMKGKK